LRRSAFVIEIAVPALEVLVARAPRLRRRLFAATLLVEPHLFLLDAIAFGKRGLGGDWPVERRG
jgi:hypothetical protein